jgi:hypothetical protein
VKTLAPLLLLLAACASGPGLDSHVRTLAAPEYEGRETGTDGERRAADYIAARLREAGAEVRVQEFQGHGTTGRNVIGLIRGSSDEVVVVLGAHYDHLGLAKQGVNHGADDNASGTAAILEIARRLAARPARRGLVVIAFSGEEMGLLGSKAYCRTPAVPIEKTVAMVNLDMVGRLREKLAVFGADTGDRFRGFLADSPIPLSFSRDALGPSDHTSFILKGVPSVHLFTGAHPDYHKPGDVAEKINYAGLARVTDLAETLVRRLADDPGRMVFVKPKADDTALPAPGPGGMPYLGLMPDYAFEGEGVRLDAVSPGSPAEKAGLKEGDVIRSVNGGAVDNVKSYSALFFRLKPGDKMKLEIDRDRAPMTVDVVVGSKRRSEE